MRRRLRAPRDRAVRLHERQEDEQVGDAESEPEEGAAAPGCAPPQRERRQHDGGGAEEDVEDEQAQQAQHEGRDGHPVGVMDSGARPAGAVRCMVIGFPRSGVCGADGTYGLVRVSARRCRVGGRGARAARRRRARRR